MPGDYHTSCWGGRVCHDTLIPAHGIYCIFWLPSSGYTYRGISQSQKLVQRKNQLYTRHISLSSCSNPRSSFTGQTALSLRADMICPSLDPGRGRVSSSGVKRCDSFELCLEAALPECFCSPAKDGLPLSKERLSAGWAKEFKRICACDVRQPRPATAAELFG
jgi:hypothetical protein